MIAIFAALVALLPLLALVIWLAARGADGSGYGGAGSNAGDYVGGGPGGGDSGGGGCDGGDGGGCD
jgi:hypothetical protein